MYLQSTSSTHGHSSKMPFQSKMYPICVESLHIPIYKHSTQIGLYFSCWVIFSRWLFHEAALCFMFQVRHSIFFLWHSLYCTVLMWILWSKELNFLHFCHIIFGDFSMQKSHKYIHIIHLTAVAWVSGPDLAPQKMKLCQKFRHLMRCKKYLEN